MTFWAWRICRPRDLGAGSEPGNTIVNPLDLTGRRYLITGASSGIGREIAILLSELGAVTVLTGRNPERLAETCTRLSGSGHRAVPFDLAALDQIPGWMKEIAGGGPLDGF